MADKPTKDKAGDPGAIAELLMSDGRLMAIVTMALGNIAMRRQNKGGALN